MTVFEIVITAPPVRAAEPGAQGYTVQQATRLTGLSEHTLRYYVRARLLDPIRRQDSSGHRRRSGDDVARVRTLACLRAAGIPLEGMRRYFELLGQGETDAALQHEMLVAQREVLQERLRQLEGHRPYLDRKIDYWRAVERGDPARADAIVAQIACEHFSREP